MSEHWATQLITTLQQRVPAKANASGTEFEVLLGRIVTAKPLSIEINGQPIKKYLYINPAYTVLADDTTDKILEAFADTLKLAGGMDGIQRQPKNRADTSVIDRYINVEYTVNPIVDVAWYDFLREFHQKFVLKKGDEVIVIHMGVSFFIVSKVVTA